jgi:hypothetical protein
VSTNDRGEYRLDDIAPGQHYLQAEEPVDLAGAEPLAQQFFGGSRESKDSTILNIHGDENVTGVDFHMTPASATVQIHGRVTGVPDTKDIRAGR